MALNMETVLKVRAQVTGADKVNGLSTNLGKLDNNAKKTTTTFGKLKTASSGLVGAFASLGVSALVTKFGAAAIQSQRLDTRLKNLTEQTGEYDEVIKFASVSAERFGIGQNTATKAVADLYGRLRPTGVSLNSIKTAFIGVNNAAAQVGLSAADTDGVLLQLSQALGSGAFQGDEFRSVMERLPAVGQALATSLNVPIGALKKMGADGELTTEVVLTALEKLKNVQPPPPDAYKQFTAAVENLSIAFGEKLLPAFLPLVQLATNAINLFSQLPGPLQTIIALVGGLAAALVIIAPLIPLISALGPALLAIGGALMAGIGAVSAWGASLAALAAGLPAIGTALAGVIALITGPVGIAVAIGIALGALFVFREDVPKIFSDIGTAITDVFNGIIDAIADVFEKPLSEVFKTIVDNTPSIFNPITSFILAPFGLAIAGLTGVFSTPIGTAVKGAVDLIKNNWSGLLDILKQPYIAAFQFFKQRFFEPIGGAFRSTKDAVKEIWAEVEKFLTDPIGNAFKFISDTFSKVGNVILSPFKAVVDPIKAVFNSIIGAVSKIVNNAINGINGLIKAANAIGGAIGLPSISLLRTIELPKFAEGGLVNGPTVALVGEAGPEYIVPQGKADGFVENWLAGRRGAAAIPRFAEGGFVTSGAAPSVNITTGPVIQQDGQTYVTTGDLERALTTFGKTMVQSQRSIGSRRFLGV